MLRFAVVLGLTVLSTAHAASQDHPIRTIAFAHGTSSATFEQSLERGSSDTFRFDAKSGQEADIQVSSIENNASFVIYTPPSKATSSPDGSGYDIDGAKLMGGDKTVPPLDSGAEKRWRGKLPANGTYYISVSTDRGNATYKLSVAIK